MTKQKEEGPFLSLGTALQGGSPLTAVICAPFISLLEIPYTQIKRHLPYLELSANHEALEGFYKLYWYQVA